MKNKKELHKEEMAQVTGGQGIHLYDSLDTITGEQLEDLRRRAEEIGRRPDRSPSLTGGVIALENESPFSSRLDQGFRSLV